MFAKKKYQDLAWQLLPQMESGPTLESLSLAEEDTDERQHIYIAQYLLNSPKFSAPLTKVELFGKTEVKAQILIDTIQAHQ